MKFSIITATWNSSKTLEDTIKSVLCQTYKNYEYIIIDGLSKDNTLEIANYYMPYFDGRMKIFSERDNGIYDAMNKGFKRATGDVLMLINSDDLFSRPDALELIAEKFKTNPNIDGVYADLYYVSQNNINKIVRVWKTGKQKQMRYGWLPAHPTFYVKRQIYEQYGLFDLSFKLAADFELMLRYIDKYKIKIVYLSECLVKMRLGGATSGSFKNIVKQNIECIKAFKKNKLKVSYLYPFFRFLPKIKQFL